MQPNTSWNLFFSKSIHYLTYHGIQFIPPLILLTLLYPISHHLLAPMWSLFFPLSHTSLEKTLAIYTAFFWIPVLFKLPFALRSQA
jgi:hypothetical protein